MNLLARVAAEAFVAGLWQGLVLVVAVWLGLKALPRMGAGVRFAVWAAAFAVAVVLPFLHFAGSGKAAGATGSGGPVLRVGAGWGLAVAAVWVGMSVWRLGVLGAEGLRLRGIWRRAVPVLADGLSGVLGRAELCVSGDVDSPSVIGFWAPRLLIPEALFGRLTDGELRQIVLHECEHLRRRDDWVNLAQKVGLALFPLNPALLWVDRRLGLERELACDAGVVAATAEPFDYARCLTRLAEHRTGVRRVALALSAWSRRPELVERVSRLLKPVRAMSVVQARMAVAVLAVGLGGAAVEMARAPRLVAFVDVPSSAGALVAGVNGAEPFKAAPAKSFFFEGAPSVGGAKSVPLKAGKGMAVEGQARMTLAKMVVPAGSGQRIIADSAALTASREGMKAAPFKAILAEDRVATPRVEQFSRVFHPSASLRADDAAERQIIATLDDRIADGLNSESEAQEQARVLMTRAQEMVVRGPDGVVHRYATRAVFAIAKDTPEGARGDGVAAVSGTALSARASDKGVRYAAVPFGNGWLIIQL